MFILSAYKLRVNFHLFSSFQLNKVLILSKNFPIQVSLRTLIMSKTRSNQRNPQILAFH